MWQFLLLVYAGRKRSEISSSIEFRDAYCEQEAFVDDPAVRQMAASSLHEDDGMTKIVTNKVLFTTHVLKRQVGHLYAEPLLLEWADRLAKDKYKSLFEEPPSSG